MADMDASLQYSNQPALFLTTSTLDSSLYARQTYQPQKNGPDLRLNVSIWLLAVLSLLFLGMRVRCKFHRGRRLWWDDYLLIASWVRASNLIANLGKCHTGPNFVTLDRPVCSWAVCCSLPICASVMGWNPRISHPVSWWPAGWFRKPPASS
jgi:hypothetical protein